MDLIHKDKFYKPAENSSGFAIPQVLILGIGIAIGVSGLMAASILSLLGSRISRQELIAKASSYSGITTIRSLLNDSSQGSLYHYFWLVDSCSQNGSGCIETTIPNPSTEYWPDDDWCSGIPNCIGRQKAPMCIPKAETNWDEKIYTYSKLFDNKPDYIGFDLQNSPRNFKQTFDIISTKYTGTENYGISSILIEGKAISQKSEEQTASNKLRVNIQVTSQTSESGFGYLSVGENQSDGINSLFLGNLTIKNADSDNNQLYQNQSLNPKGFIIWRRNLKETIDTCGDFLTEANYTGDSLPDNVDGGIWVQPLRLPKQPRLSNVNDIGILICTPNEIEKDSNNCILNSQADSDKVYRIHSLYAKGPGSRFEISTRDNSRVILEIMGDIDISNGGIFCHRNGLERCGSGKAQNLTILFKQKTDLEGSQIVCNNLDDFSGGVKFKDIDSVNFDNYEYPLDNNKLPGSSFLIDNTGENNTDEFGAFIYGPKVTLISVHPESEWVQITNTDEEDNNVGMIVTSRASYGWIKNTQSDLLEDKMVNLILTPDSKLIPYLGQKELSGSNENEPTQIEVIGVGYKVKSFSSQIPLNTSADKVFLIFNRTSGNYYLRTFYIQEINPVKEASSLYSYPRSFARIDPYANSTHYDLGSDLSDLTVEGEELLDSFGINYRKLTNNSVRNFSGAAWVKNLCFDGQKEWTWTFSKNFRDGLIEWHGEQFDWGVNYYRGRSIILWDTLRDFNS